MANTFIGTYHRFITVVISERKSRKTRQTTARFSMTLHHRYRWRVADESNRVCMYNLLTMRRSTHNCSGVWCTSRGIAIRSIPKLSLLGRWRRSSVSCRGTTPSAARWRTVACLFPRGACAWDTMIEKGGNRLHMLQNNSVSVSVAAERKGSQVSILGICLQISPKNTDLQIPS